MTRPEAAPNGERTLFRIAVFMLALVPVSAGLAGTLLGAGFPGLDAGQSSVNLDSHFRYLSGLLLGIGLAFWSTVLRPMPRLRLFRALCIIVIVGGVGRLLSVFAVGSPETPHLAALVMELIVTPALLLWSLRLRTSP